MAERSEFEEVLLRFEDGSNQLVRVGVGIAPVKLRSKPIAEDLHKMSNCPRCIKFVKSNQSNFNCGACHRWYHCACEGAHAPKKKEDFDLAVNFEWKCFDCSARARAGLDSDTSVLLDIPTEDIQPRSKRAPSQSNADETLNIVLTAHIGDTVTYEVQRVHELTEWKTYSGKVIEKDSNGIWIRMQKETNMIGIPSNGFKYQNFTIERERERTRPVPPTEHLVSDDELDDAPNDRLQRRRRAEPPPQQANLHDMHAIAHLLAEAISANAPKPPTDPNVVVLTREQLQQIIESKTPKEPGEKTDVDTGLADALSSLSKNIKSIAKKRDKHTKHEDSSSSSDGEKDEEDEEHSDEDELTKLTTSVKLWKKMHLLSDPKRAMTLRDSLRIRYAAGVQSSFVEDKFRILDKMIQVYSRGKTIKLTKSMTHDLREALWDLRTACEVERKFPTNMHARKECYASMVKTYKQKYDPAADTFEKAFAEVSTKLGKSDKTSKDKTKRSRRACYTCGSADHFAANCPNGSKAKNVSGGHSSSLPATTAKKPTF